MKKTITLKDVAGYATENAVWQMMLNLSEICGQDKLKNIASDGIAVAGNSFVLDGGHTSGPEATTAFAAPEMFDNKTDCPSEASDIWTLGALAFYAITGTDVFEGKGGSTQTKETDVPRLSSGHASQKLSKMIYQCLSYTPMERPTKNEIQQQAREILAQPAVPRKRLSAQGGKSYSSSLIKFWPEEMIPLLLVVVLFLFPMHLFAQQKTNFDKSVIPNEMATLVLRCIDLRSPHNAGKVSKAMDRDMNWTMMDELPLDKKGECTTKDKVDCFGLNDVGFSILKRHGGVTNSGSRFRDGRDPRYKFSFIEITVKQGASVSYPISGREGEQLFAIVPFEKDANFQAFVTKDGQQTAGVMADDVCYVWLKQGVKKGNTLTLTIKNGANKNMAFALINYNSRNHE